MRFSRALMLRSASAPKVGQQGVLLRSPSWQIPREHPKAMKVDEQSSASVAVGVLAVPLPCPRTDFWCCAAHSSPRAGEAVMAALPFGTVRP